MSWQPDLKGVPEVKSSGTILDKAVHECVKRLQRHPIKLYKDKYGRVGYELQDAILVAKKELYGYLVSCHTTIVEEAYEKNKIVLMYILKTDTFYKFDPFEILRKGVPNKRGGVEMLNFPIGMGINFEKGLDRWF